MSKPQDESPAADGFAGFGKFVPGFDFLQNLVTQTAASAAKAPAMAGGAVQMPGLGGWIAPTLNVEELDRRIQELKTVQFWLDQNATALKATVTALEVQKMTLVTLKDMNFNMNEVASAFKAKATQSFAGMAPAAAPVATAAPADKSRAFAGLEVPPNVFGTPSPEPEPAPEPEPTVAAATAATPNAAAAASADTAPAGGGVDPMKWWGALTQQFQAIAADAMKDVARQAAQVAPQQAVAMAEQAAASVAATGKALADNASTTLAGGAVAMGKALRQQAWPVPNAAGAPAASKPARAKTKSPTAGPAKTRQPAAKKVVAVAAKSGRVAPGKAVAAKSPARKSAAKSAAKPATKSARKPER